MIQVKDANLDAAIVYRMRGEHDGWFYAGKIGKEPNRKVNMVYNLARAKLFGPWEVEARHAAEAFMTEQGYHFEAIELKAKDN